MKLPLSIPSGIKPGNFQQIMEAMQADPEAFKAEQDGTYLHWDELKFRPPRNISHELWWSMVKLARFSARRRLPLVDASNEGFSFVMTDTIERALHEVDRDASGQISLPEDVSSQGTRDRYIVNSLIEEAFRSSQLEGASTTRHVAKEMIRTKREPRTHSERMIQNNFFAMEWVRAHHKDRLTTAALFELHTIVTRGTLETTDGAGRFRRSDEDVTVVDEAKLEVVHRPPPADLLPARIEALCKFANATGEDGEAFVHPVIRAIMLHFWLAYDHPFVDGNGRTARLLFYWSMLNQNYWLAEYISISRAIGKARGQYDRAFVLTESDDNDATYFILNQLKMLRGAIQELFVYLRAKSEEMREVERAMRGRDDLNNRQLALVGHAVRHPDATFTIDGHQTSHRVVYETARTDLLHLVERGYLEQSKIGRKLNFSPVRNLERLLAKNR